jgi:DNA-binding MarR family transcriptional regulator
MLDDETRRAQRLALTLHRATALVDRVADAYLRPSHGIGISSFAALVTIDALQPARQSEIARGLDVSRAAVTQRLGGLVERGLIAIAPDEADSRANLVRLTPSGQRLLADAWSGLARQDDGVEDGIDLAALQASLDRLIANAVRYLDGLDTTP